MADICGFSLVGFAYGDGTQPAKACCLSKGHDGRHSDPAHGYFDGPTAMSSLLAGFELGAQWTSYDNGLTWVRFPAAVPSTHPRDTLTVTAVDYRRGIVTMGVGNG